MPRLQLPHDPKNEGLLRISGWTTEKIEVAADSRLAATHVSRAFGMDAILSQAL
jgi:hypothetical protein